MQAFPCHTHAQGFGGSSAPHKSRAADWHWLCQCPARHTQGIAIAFSGAATNLTRAATVARQAVLLHQFLQVPPGRLPEVGAQHRPAPRQSRQDQLLELLVSLTAGAPWLAPGTAVPACLSLSTCKKGRGPEPRWAGGSGDAVGQARPMRGPRASCSLAQLSRQPSFCSTSPAALPRQQAQPSPEHAPTTAQASQKIGCPCPGPIWPGCTAPGSGPRRLGCSQRLGRAWGWMLLGKPGAQADPPRTHLALVPLLAATISSTKSIFCRPTGTWTGHSYTPEGSRTPDPGSHPQPQVTPSHKSPPASYLPYLQVWDHGEQGDSGHQKHEAVEKDKGSGDKERAAVNHHR